MTTLTGHAESNAPSTRARGRIRTAFVATAAALALVGCVGDLDEPRIYGMQGNPIVGGAPESGYPAVGALIANGAPFCTGTLVSSDIFVTAAHCLMGGESPSDVQIYFGSNAYEPSSGTVVNVNALVRHPTYDDESGENDIAVVRLSSSPDVQPIPILSESMADGWIGREPVFVGFGVRSATSEEDGVKYSVTVPITEVADTTFTYEAQRRNTCYGDSGGPALFETSSGVRLIGVTSHGDEDCIEYGVNTRVDSFKDWVQSYISGTGTIPDPNTNPNPNPNPDTDPNPGGDNGGEDWCQAEGWYGDGICDEDCPNPDPDCSGDSADNGDSDTSDNGGEDWCQAEGWYGDGICDEDCPNPDPDCSGDSANSGADDNWDDGDDANWDDGGDAPQANGDDPQANGDDNSSEPTVGGGSTNDRPGRPNADEPNNDGNVSFPNGNGCSVGGGGGAANGALWFLALVPMMIRLRRRK